MTAELPEILPLENFAVIVNPLGSSELSVQPVRRQTVPSRACVSPLEAPAPGRAEQRDQEHHGHKHPGQAQSHAGPPFILGNTDRVTPAGVGKFAQRPRHGYPAGSWQS